MTAMTDRRVRLLGLAAMLAGALGLLYAPFYAAAYFATPDGAESGESAVLPWHEPFRDAVGPMLTFASPHDVYVTYGKAANLVFAGFLAGLVALHAWQRGSAGRFERATYRFALVATGLLTAGSLVIYWLPEAYWETHVDYAFMALAVPGLVLTLIALPLYGWATLRARVAPRAVGWLLVLGALPGIPVLTVLTGQLTTGLMGVFVAFVVAGRAAWRSGKATEAAPPVEAAVRAEGS